jgi:hypothetical protein
LKREKCKEDKAGVVWVLHSIPSSHPSRGCQMHADPITSVTAFNSLWVSSTLLIPKDYLQCEILLSPLNREIYIVGFHRDLFIFHIFNLLKKY